MNCLVCTNEFAKKQMNVRSGVTNPPLCVQDAKYVPMFPRLPTRTTFVYARKTPQKVYRAGHLFLLPLTWWTLMENTSTIWGGEAPDPCQVPTTVRSNHPTTRVCHSLAIPWEQKKIRNHLYLTPSPHRQPLVHPPFHYPFLSRYQWRPTGHLFHQHHHLKRPSPN